MGPRSPKAAKGALFGGSAQETAVMIGERIAQFPARLKPGHWLMVMTYWWVLIFFFIRLAHYPLLEHLSSYLLYFVVFAVTLIFAQLANLVEERSSTWERAGYWKRYVLVCCLYGMNMAVILTVTVTLHARGLMGTFGGDPEGSVGVLFVWTIPLYVVIAGVFGICRALWIKLGNRSSGG
jgi:hypothetical protein